ncbi:MAG: adenylate kinase [Clostridiaceae bacterium]|nr:adenylate kinase [Clostridiaceae bacterium]
MDLLIIGAPGAGKGTISELIAQVFPDIHHLSTGNLLRREIAADTELGRQADRLMSTGNLVPDEMVLSLVCNYLSELPPHTSVLYDGYPRTLSQAKTLDEVLSSVGRSVTAVLNVVVPEEVILSRLTGRRSCPKCGASFHLTAIPPRVAGVCDTCGSELIQRNDDQPELIRRRLEIYRERTQPLIDFYEERALLYDIKNDGHPCEMSVELAELLAELAENRRNDCN